MSAWSAAPGPFRYVLAAPRPDAVVEAWLEPEFVPEASSRELGDLLPAGRAPLLVRRPLGFGSVTWLAVDLGNRNVAGLPDNETRGWTAFWAELLDVGDDPVLDPSESEQERHLRGALVDLSEGPSEATRLPGRGVALVTVALVFFIGYWLLAGPGLYFYLAQKKRTHLSWFGFGLVAAAAALLTVGVTSLVLRGPPDLRHLSVLRAGPEVPRVVRAQLGLYIPRDGVQAISLDEGSSREPVLAALTPPANPAPFVRRINPVTYVVPIDPPPGAEVPGALTGETAVVEIPYRSTLKKLEGTWTGAALQGIEGSPALRRGVLYPVGPLVNTSGFDLVNVHLVFKDTRRVGDDIAILWLPRWNDGETLPGLEDLFRPEDPEARVKLVSRLATSGTGRPGQEPLRGMLVGDWARAYWYGDPSLRRSLTNFATVQGWDDWSGRQPRSTPAMLSLFSMLPPMRVQQSLGEPIALERRGMRHWDVSAAVSAGSLVVIGEALAVPAPLPLKVDGQRVEGTGTVIAQFVVPLDRRSVNAQLLERNAQ